MSQEQILQILKNNPNKWFISNDFVRILKTSSGAVSMNLRKIRKNWDCIIEYKHIHLDFRWKYAYRYKKKRGKR